MALQFLWANEQGIPIKHFKMFYARNLQFLQPDVQQQTWKNKFVFACGCGLSVCSISSLDIRRSVKVIKLLVEGRRHDFALLNRRSLMRREQPLEWIQCGGSKVVP